MLALIAFLAIPLVLIGAAPQWWTSGHIYHTEGGSVAESSDYSPANLGQLKHFAVTAYEYLRQETGEYGDPTPPPTNSQPSTLNHRAASLGDCAPASGNTWSLIRRRAAIYLPSSAKTGRLCARSTPPQPTTPCSIKASSKPPPRSLACLQKLIHSL